MKKIMILLAIVLLTAGAAYGQAPVNMDKGDFSIAAGVNFGWDYGVGGSVEYMFARVDIADELPITFGLAARVGVGFFHGTNYTVAGLTSAHMSLGFIPGLPLWLTKFDLYYGLGLGFGAGTDFGVGIASGGGIAYYLEHDIAIYTSGIYVRYFDNTGGGSGFGSVGLIFKL